MFQKKIFILIFLSLLIISCGGGGGGTSEQAPGINAATPSVTPVPTSPQNSNTIYHAGNVVFKSSDKMTFLPVSSFIFL